MADLGKLSTTRRADPYGQSRTHDRLCRMTVARARWPRLPQRLDDVVLCEFRYDHCRLYLCVRLNGAESMGQTAILGSVPVLIQVPVVEPHRDNRAKGCR